ncbi:MAG: tetratricopeptide repeat protein, partial [Saprospiraceae bacterium]|nr:tetratricopeptide repeat protein [Saprospiraceae bacterium]
ETERVGLKYLDAQAFLYKGIALLGLERPDAAQAAFELGLTVEAGNADLLYWLAKTLLQRGQGAQAEILLREAMEQFKKGKHNTTTYVEEFYQTYWPDLEALAAQLKQ